MRQSSAPLWRESRRTWLSTHFSSRKRSTTFTIPIIHEETREKKVFLLWMTDFFRRQLEWTLDILGIQVPDYM
jgi:hypothetical protein